MIGVGLIRAGSATEGNMYKYRANSIYRAIHILNPKTGKTVCNAEKGTGGKNITTVSETLPPGRRLCANCETPVIPKKRTTFVFSQPQPTKITNRNFYSSWEWKKLRFEVLKAYGPVCMLCRSDRNIVVDHIKPRSRFPDLALDFDNMQILCDDCNRGKSNDDYTDFRPKDPLKEITDEQFAHIRTILQ